MAIYSTYIEQYQTQNNGQSEIHTSRHLVYDVPISQPERAFIDPVLKTEMGKAGSFEFSVMPDHSYYNSWLQMKTMLHVRMGEQRDAVPAIPGETIFRGRVLTIDVSPLNGLKKIHCEGDLAFLLDSQQPMTHEESRKEISVYDYLFNMLKEHNRQMNLSEPGEKDDKKFYLGEVPGGYSKDIAKAQKLSPPKKKYGSKNWETTMNALEALSKEYGGFFRTRYTQDYTGQYGRGNIDLNNRTVVEIRDNNVVTESPIKVEIDNRFVVLPRVINGAEYDDANAVAYYNNAGENGEYLGKFNTEEQADAYISLLQERQNWKYNGKDIRYLCFLDWLDSYYQKDVHPESIAVTKNMINMDMSTEVDNIFTVLIPIGSKDGKEIYLNGYEHEYTVNGATRKLAAWGTNYIKIPDLDTLVTQGVIAESKLTVGYHTRTDYANAIHDYGIIFKPQKFDNADTQKKLFEYAIDWIVDNYISRLTSYDVSALDLYHANPSIYTRYYLTGDRIPIQYPDSDHLNANGASGRVNVTQTMLGVEYHLHNPEKNSYSIGVPNPQIQRTYGTAKNKKTKSGTPDNKDDILNETKADLGEVEETLWDYVVNAYYNNDMYPDLDENQVATIMKTQYLFLNDVKRDPRGAAGILLDGITGKIKFDVHNPLDERRAIRKAEIYEGGISYLRYLSSSGAEALTPVQSFKIVGATGEMLASRVMLGTNAEGDTVGINLDGIDNLISLFGKDNVTGDLFKSIDISGFQNFLKFFKKPEAGDDPDDPDPTMEFNGNNGSIGAGAATTTTDPNTGKKQTTYGVNIGAPITYTGSDGQTHTTTKNIVSAEDFALTNVPSFSTSFAFIKQLVVSELWATKITVDNLTANTITSASGITAQRLGAQVGYFDQIHVLNGNGYDGTITAHGYRHRVAGSNQIVNLENCFSGAEFHEGDGGSLYSDTSKIYLRLLRAGGGDQTVNFSIASTQTYIDGVEAAKTEAKNSVKIEKGNLVNGSWSNNTWINGKITVRTYVPGGNISIPDSKAIQLMSDPTNAWNGYQYDCSIVEVIDEEREIYASTGLVIPINATSIVRVAQGNVQIKKNNWSNGRLTLETYVTGANISSKTATVQLMAAQTNGWNGNVYNFDIWEYVDENTHNTTGFPTVQIDATSIVRTGQGNVQIKKNNWSNGQLTLETYVAGANINSKTATVQLMTASTNAWNGNNYTCSVWEYIDENTHRDTGLSVQINANSIFDNGGRSAFVESGTATKAVEDWLITTNGMVDLIVYWPKADGTGYDIASRKTMKVNVPTASGITASVYPVTWSSVVNKFYTQGYAKDSNDTIISQTAITYSDELQIDVSSAWTTNSSAHSATKRVYAKTTDGTTATTLLYGDVTVTADAAAPQWDATERKFYSVGRIKDGNTIIATSGQVATGNALNIDTSEAWSSGQKRVYLRIASGDAGILLSEVVNAPSTSHTPQVNTGSWAGPFTTRSDVAQAFGLDNENRVHNAKSGAINANKYWGFEVNCGGSNPVYYYVNVNVPVPEGTGSGSWNGSTDTSANRIYTVTLTGGSGSYSRSFSIGGDDSHNGIIYLKESIYNSSTGSWEWQKRMQCGIANASYGVTLTRVRAGLDSDNSVITTGVLYYKNARTGGYSPVVSESSNYAWYYGPVNTSNNTHNELCGVTNSKTIYHY